MTVPSALQSDYRYAVDNTEALQAPAGLLRLAGWIAGWPGKAPSVRLRLDPALVFDCRVGLPRPDVANAHPDVPEAALSGFALETYVPAGFHLGTLEFLLSDLSEWTPFHTLSINAGLSPLLAKLECPTPADSAGLEWYLHGWCFHPQFDIEHLSVQFAHVQLVLRHQMARPDVSDIFPKFPTATRSGFSGHLHLEPGVGELTLTARLSNGSVLRHTLIPSVTITDQVLQQAIRDANIVQARRIKLVTHDRVEVSIIIPIFNQLDLTLACLESLVRHAGPTKFEVILIDDKSDAFVSEALSLVSGLRHLRNVENQGFVLNCNRGASEARGDYLLFLNNDTEVCSGWLEAMLAVFTEKPDAGAVGAKLEYANGKLQEAGGIIWEDGSGLNWGKGEDPARPEFNYLRRVDYCSGACLLVKRTIFSEVGGFDTRYCPAYYEDVDLAFTLRARGLHTYYQPRARVVHHEGMSSGTSTTSGVKRHQAVNQGRFFAKWEPQLEHHSTGTHMTGLARDRFSPVRILVIDACALTPDMDAGSVRMFNMLLILARLGHKVTFGAENLQVHEPFSSTLKAHGVEHLSVPFTHSLQHYLEESGFTFDVAIISRKHVASRFLPFVRKYAPTCKIVFDTVDLMFLRLARQAALEDSEKLRLEAAESQAEELALVHASDLTFVVSQAEADVLAAEAPLDKLAVVPLINDFVESPHPFCDRSGILFVGGFQHPPNLDGILFFLDEVLPIIRKREPDIQVHIVGSRTPPALAARATSGVLVHGFVPDLSAILSSVRLSIAPLRFGAGIKGKISQSMACGVPVVGTTIAVDGMHLDNGINCLVADSPADFAEAVCRLHEDESLWHRIAESGQEHARSMFSSDAVKTQMVAALSKLVDFSAQVPRPLPIRAAENLPFGQRIECGPDSAAEKYLAGGWSAPSGKHCWSVGPKALIYFKIDEEVPAARLSITVFPYLSPPDHVRQRVHVVTPCSSAPSEFVLDHAKPTVLHIDLKNLSRYRELISIELRFPDARSPQSLGASKDVRALGVTLFGFSLERCT